MNKTITLATLFLSASAVQVKTGDVFSDIADWFENDFVDFWEDDFVEFWEEDFVNFWEDDFVGAFEDLGDWFSDAWDDINDWLDEDVFGDDIKDFCTSVEYGHKIRENLPDSLMTSTEDWIDYWII